MNSVAGKLIYIPLTRFLFFSHAWGNPLQSNQSMFDCRGCVTGQGDLNITTLRLLTVAIFSVSGSLLAADCTAESVQQHQISIRRPDV